MVSLLSTIYHCFQINVLVQLLSLECLTIIYIRIWLYGRCHSLPFIKFCCLFTCFVFHFNFKLVVVVSSALCDGTVDDIVESLLLILWCHILYLVQLYAWH